MAAVLIIAIIISGIGLLVLLSGIALYNRLVTLRALVSSSRLDMEALLRKKHAKASEQTGKGESDFSEYRSQMQLRRAEALRIYNDAVWAYNTAIETFPANLLARWFGLKKEEPLDTPETSE